MQVIFLGVTDASMKICRRFVIFAPGELEKRSLKVLEFFGLMLYEPCLLKCCYECRGHKSLL